MRYTIIWRETKYFSKTFEAKSPDDAKDEWERLGFNMDADEDFLIIESDDGEHGFYLIKNGSSRC